MSNDALKETALRVSVLVDALESRSESALRSLEASAGALIHTAGSLGQQGQSASSAALAAAQQLDAQTARLARQQRSMLWVSGVALGVGALLAVAGSTVFVWAKWRELQQIEFAEQIHRATESGALAPCGESLCVRVPKEPTRMGANGEYIVVQ
jgi:hypothetical protein